MAEPTVLRLGSSNMGTRTKGTWQRSSLGDGKGKMGRESSEDWFIDTHLGQDKEAKSPSQLLKD